MSWNDIFPGPKGNERPVEGTPATFTASSCALRGESASLSALGRPNRHVSVASPPAPAQPLGRCLGSHVPPSPQRHPPPPQCPGPPAEHGPQLMHPRPPVSAVANQRLLPVTRTPAPLLSGLAAPLQPPPKLLHPSPRVQPPAHGPLAVSPGVPSVLTAGPDSLDVCLSHPPGRNNNN